MTNSDIAARLRELHDYLVVAGYDPTHAGRYVRLARAIEKAPEDVGEMVRGGRGRELPGVGPMVLVTLKEIVAGERPSKAGEFDVPWSVTELTKIPGVGPVKARRLYEQGITNRAEYDAAHGG